MYNMIRWHSIQFIEAGSFAVKEKNSIGVVEKLIYQNIAVPSRNNKRY